MPKAVKADAKKSMIAFKGSQAQIEVVIMGL
jgi:hypothetical protein